MFLWYNNGKEGVGKMGKKPSFGEPHMIKLNTETKAVKAIMDKSVNQRVLAMNTEIISLPAYDINDVNSLADRIKSYFEITEKYDIKPNIETFAMSLGFNKRHISKIVNGQDTAYLKKECRDLIKQITNILNANLVTLAMENQVNPVMAIFLAKNNYGYTDKTEISTTIASENLSSDDILKKYECIE